MRRNLAAWLALSLAASPLWAGFEAKTVDVPAENSLALLPAPSISLAQPQIALAAPPAATPLTRLNAAATGLADPRKDKPQVLNGLFEKPSAPPVESEAMSFLEARDALRELSRRAGLKRAPDLKMDRREPENAVAEFDLFKRGDVVHVGPILLLDSSRREMTAILAHELGHIAGAHKRLLLRVVLPTLLVMALPILAWAAWGPAASLPYVVGLSAIAAAWTANALYFTHPDREEFAADAFSARLTGDPEALASVLERRGAGDSQAKERAARLRAMKTSK